MADYKVTDTELISIANAIRTKGGTSAQLEFPDDFVDAIDNLTPTGGDEEVYAGDFTPTKDANSAKSAGWKFTTINSIRLSGVRFFARSTSASVFISDISGNVIKSATNKTVIAEQWNDVYFDSPITLDANTQYVVWGSNSNTTMKYYDDDISPTIVTFNGTVWGSSYSTFPATTEIKTTYGIDLIILVPSGVIKPLTVTQNGTYTPPSGVDGYAPVTVNVSCGGSADIEIDFTNLGTKTVDDVDYSSAGATFNADYDKIVIGALPRIIAVDGVTIEVDVASMSLSSGGSDKRFLMGSISSGFIYRSSGVWAFYTNNWENGVFADATDGSLFDNCTVKLYIDSSNKWHIYKDDVLIFEPASALSISNFAIGSAGNSSINNAIITALRIYKGQH